MNRTQGSRTHSRAIQPKVRLAVSRTIEGNCPGIAEMTS